MLTDHLNFLQLLQAFVTIPSLFLYLLLIMACLNFSYLFDLLHSWLKHSGTIPSNPDQPYARPSCNISLVEEGSSPLATYESPGNSSTENVYVPGITELPSPPSAYLSTISKPDMHGYQGCEPCSFNQTPPIPKEKATSFDSNVKRLPALHRPSIFFPSTSDIRAGQPMKSSSLYITIIITFLKV